MTFGTRLNPKLKAMAAVATMMTPLPPFPFLSSHIENDNIDYL
jgi:hypothetical protein